MPPYIIPRRRRSADGAALRDRQAPVNAAAARPVAAQSTERRV
jgi:hypothetical protein